MKGILSPHLNYSRTNTLKTMGRTVLLGKGRRVTLDELEAVALYGGTLEIHTADSTDAGNTSDFSADMTAATIFTALTLLSIGGDGGDYEASSKLSVGNTRAILTLLANFIAQQRLKGSTPADRDMNVSCTSAIAYIVNTSDIVKLPSSADGFVKALIALIPDAVKCKCVKEHLTSISAQLQKALARIIPLAITALATIQTSRLTKTAVIDALAALSVEKGMACSQMNVDPAIFADGNYDINRPHRGMMTSASVIRVCVQGSKFAPSNSTIDVTSSGPGSASASASASASEEQKSAMESIPAYHGPAADVIVTSLKLLELECNCFESLESSQSKNDDNLAALDVTVVSMACNTVGNAVKILLEGCLQRIGECESSADDDADADATSSGNDITADAVALSNNVEALYSSLTKEVTTNKEFISAQTQIAAEAAKKKAEEKAARAAARNNAAGGGAGNNKKDEFEGMSEAQKKKILKKRADKEAKAAKKKKAKASADGAGGGVSVFGAGSMAILGCMGTASVELSPTIIAKMEEVIGKLLSGGVQRKPKIAKGTRDYLPEQMMIRDQAFQIIRRVFKSHGGTYFVTVHVLYSV